MSEGVHDVTEKPSPRPVKIPPGVLMSPPWDDADVHIAMLEDQVRELAVVIRDHELRFREQEGQRRQP